LFLFDEAGCILLAAYVIAATANCFFGFARKASK